MQVHTVHSIRHTVKQFILAPVVQDILKTSKDGEIVMNAMKILLEIVYRNEFSATKQLDNSTFEKVMEDRPKN